AAPAGPIAVGADFWEFQAPILVAEPRARQLHAPAALVAGGRAGTVAVGISRESLQILQRRTVTTAALFTALFTVVAVLAAVVLTRAITRPLTALASAADAIARGDLHATVLDFARLSSGHISFQVERFALAPLLTEIQTLHTGRLRNPRLGLTVTIEPDLPMFETDRVKLQEIVHNLVDNAVKFTEAGRVAVVAHAGAGDAHGAFRREVAVLLGGAPGSSLASTSRESGWSAGSRGPVPRRPATRALAGLAVQCGRRCGTGAHPSTAAMRSCAFSAPASVSTSGGARRTSVAGGGPAAHLPPPRRTRGRGGGRGRGPRRDRRVRRARRGARAYGRRAPRREPADPRAGPPRAPPGRPRRRAGDPRRSSRARAAGRGRAWP